MNLHTANSVKKLLIGFKSSGPHKNFNDESSYFFRINIHDREFQLKGADNKFNLVEVGLGTSKIGWKTLEKDIPTTEIPYVLKEISCLK